MHGREVLLLLLHPGHGLFEATLCKHQVSVKLLLKNDISLATLGRELVFLHLELHLQVLRMALQGPQMV